MKFFQFALILTSAVSLTLTSALADDCINKACPLSGKAVDGSKSVEFVAKFCCGKCVDKFEKDPTAYAEKVSKAADGKCAFSGKAAAKESKVSIAVCCGKCVKKGKADPKALLAKLQKKKD
ncbi:MAG: hypothetical protein CMO46_02585 [Verrucomicrobiales bacterium]|nr:hypothetical protein [Verrucomicrobiales bacterium]MBV63722.1 hypothetical protein [Rickettsiales bacterium]